MKKVTKKSRSEKPITLEVLLNYNRKIIKELRLAEINKIESLQREKIKHTWLIIIRALSDRGILSPGHLKEIAEMGIF